MHTCVPVNVKWQDREAIRENDFLILYYKERAVPAKCGKVTVVVTVCTRNSGVSEPLKIKTIFLCGKKKSILVTLEIFLSQYNSVS